jgi:2-polyprenyl-6-hydroxyphenyl methylase/3-demethylubiquinone-9 3-methyltransferase
VGGTATFAAVNFFSSGARVIRTMTAGKQGPNETGTHDAPKLPANAHQDSFDTSTDQRFFEYYLQQSQSGEAVARAERLVDLMTSAMQQQDSDTAFDVGDIGGGAGTLSRIFAERGHRVWCADISRDLLALGKGRASEERHAIQFVNCTATALPFADGSLDLCVVPELLEHVVEWRLVLDEAQRVLRPGGLVFLSTTNTLCPLQDEFELPLYSWYPARLKRHCEHLARTSRPALANYGKYPAVNWFTYYRLRKELQTRGFNTFWDRLDMIEQRTTGSYKARLARLLGVMPLGRLATQMFTPNSLILAGKTPASG